MVGVLQVRPEAQGVQRVPSQSVQRKGGSMSADFDLKAELELIVLAAKASGRQEEAAMHVSSWNKAAIERMINLSVASADEAEQRCKAIIDHYTGER